MITSDIELCRKTLIKGELVAFPTETVFGLGARSDSPTAINKIFELKSRPLEHPLIAHCADIDMALAISPDVPEYAYKLANKFWPGPMTLVLKRSLSDAICDESVGGVSTVAIRVPSHPIAQELLTSLGFFVSAPSANRFGHTSPTTAQHVYDEFGDDILILDGERSHCGLESTIISCVEDQPHILRSGAVTQYAIFEATGIHVDDSQETKIIAVPGSLTHHYAPDIDVIIVDSEESIYQYEYDISQCALLSLSQPIREYRYSRFVTSYDEFAHELYNFFREAENRECEAIFVIPPENEGIGIAINDRLTKASAQTIER